MFYRAAAEADSFGGVFNPLAMARAVPSAAYTHAAVLTDPSNDHELSGTALLPGAVVGFMQASVILGYLLL